MRHIITLLIIFTTLSIRAQSIDSLDAKTGFRDLVFGQRYDVYEAPEFYQSKMDKLMNSPKSKLKWYHRSTDDLNFGGTSASGIRYVFINGVFVGYSAEFKGQDNVAYITQTISGLYGPANEPMPPAAQGLATSSMTWKGAVNTCSVIVTMDGATPVTTFSFSNLVEWQKAQSESSKGIKDF